MTWIIGVALAFGGLLLLVVAAVAVIRAIIELMIRVALAAALAAIVGCIAGIVVAQWGADRIVAGIVVTLLAFVPTLSSMWNWRRLAASGPDRRKAEPHRASEDASELEIERKLGLAHAARLAAAWNTALLLAPHSDLQKMREACARFLATFEAEADCDPANVELAVFIRRHVPSLVEDTQAVLRRASQEKREALVTGLVADLRQLGQEASDASERRSAMARERLVIRRSHFASRRQVQGSLA